MTHLRGLHGQQPELRGLKKETVPFLQTPADEYLGIVFPVFVRDGCDGGVIEHPLPSLDERAVRLHNNAFILTVIHDRPLLTEWVKLTKAIEGVRDEPRACSLDI